MEQGLPSVEGELRVEPARIGTVNLFHFHATPMAAKAPKSPIPATRRLRGQLHSSKGEHWESGGQIHFYGVYQESGLTWASWRLTGN